MDGDGPGGDIVYPNTLPSRTFHYVEFEFSSTHAPPDTYPTYLFDVPMVYLDSLVRCMNSKSSGVHCSHMKAFRYPLISDAPYLEVLTKLIEKGM